MTLKYYADTDTLSIRLADDLVTPFGEMPRENVTLMLSEDGQLGEIVIDFASRVVDIDALRRSGVALKEIDRSARVRAIMHKHFVKRGNVWRSRKRAQSKLTSE